MHAFLKWCGGKSWAIDRLRTLYAPYRSFRFVDLTLGAGSVPLALLPDRVWACDINPQLIELWRWVQADGKFTLPLIYQRNYYTQCRDRYNEAVKKGIPDPELPQLLYLLCRTCFNGVHRSSSVTAFNVPFGDYKGFTGQTDLSHYKESIAHWEFSAIHCLDAIAQLTPTDFTVFDPPYDSLDGKGFISYSGKFTRTDQEKAAIALSKLATPVVAFNADTPFIRELYGGLGFSMEQHQVKRKVSCNGDRPEVPELLMTLNIDHALQP